MTHRHVETNPHFIEDPDGTTPEQRHYLPASLLPRRCHNRCAPLRGPEDQDQHPHPLGSSLPEPHHGSQHHHHYMLGCRLQYKMRIDTPNYDHNPHRFKVKSPKVTSATAGIPKIIILTLVLFSQGTIKPALWHGLRQLSV
ncbi:uncharacterized protein LOC120183252 [Hibiscus syriacus]|uniref:uncharacterized protein LOC120183252 n=1 Tax=Hibiscus syriacus TaxID=106335 RepID=UPI001921CECE|nr:uncharacterized protein LOC120183252 [Hibiscus syriacus]